MRKMIVIAVTAAGFAFAGVPGVSAAPSYGTSAANAAAGVDLTQDVRVYRRRVVVRRHHHRHCWWRHGHRVCGW